MINVQMKADIFKSKMQTIVVPVNMVGVMGNGLAFAFKRRFPGLLEAYARACRQGVLKREGLFVYEVSPVRKILCFPTKRHWSDDSELELIEAGLNKLAKNWRELGITSITIPAIGCGKGNLKWEDVHPLIIKILSDIELPVNIALP